MIILISSFALKFHCCTTFTLKGPALFQCHINTLKVQQKYLNFSQMLLPRISCMTAVCNYSWKGCIHKISYQLCTWCMYKTCLGTIATIAMILVCIFADELFISGVWLQFDSRVWQCKIQNLQPNLFVRKKNRLEIVSFCENLEEVL